MQKNTKMALLYDFYGDMLTDKQKDAVDLYYHNDLSLSEIANHYGITRQGVRDTIKRAENQLFNMEEKLGLIKRFVKMKDGIDSIQVAVQDISNLNSRYGFSKDIDKQTKYIMEITEELIKL